MSDFLCLRFKDLILNDDSQVFLSVISSDGHIQSDSTCSLSELVVSLPKINKPTRTIIIVPSEAILLTTVSIPLKQQRHLNQVLDFVVEEQIVDPIEIMHLSISSFHNSENIDVAAMRSEKLQEWLTVFENIGILPDYCFADVLCVPQINTESQMLYDGDKVLLRRSKNIGISCDDNLIEPLLSFINSNRKSNKDENSDHNNSFALIFPKSVSINSADNKKTEFISKINSTDIDFKVIEYSETSSQLLCINAVKNCTGTLNLLQNNFKPKSLNIENQRFLKKASLSILIISMIFLSISLIGGSYLNYKADKYFDSSVSIYKEIFPKQKRVIDPVKQMKRQLQGQTIGGTVSDFLPLLDAASKALSNLEVDIASSITQLRYDSQRNQVIIDLRTQDIDTLEAYKELMISEGLNVSIISANQKDGMTNGRVQINQL